MQRGKCLEVLLGEAEVNIRTGLGVASSLDSLSQYARTAEVGLCNNEHDVDPCEYALTPTLVLS